MAETVKPIIPIRSPLDWQPEEADVDRALGNRPDEEVELRRTLGPVVKDLLREELGPVLRELLRTELAALLQRR